MISEISVAESPYPGLLLQGFGEFPPVVLVVGHECGVVKLITRNTLEFRRWDGGDFEVKRGPYWG
jgi:hypothetical protein